MSFNYFWVQNFNYCNYKAQQMMSQVKQAIINPQTGVTALEVPLHTLNLTTWNLP